MQNHLGRLGAVEALSCFVEGILAEVEEGDLGFFGDLGVAEVVARSDPDVKVVGAEVGAEEGEEVR